MFLPVAQAILVGMAGVVEDKKGVWSFAWGCGCNSVVPGKEGKMGHRRDRGVRRIEWWGARPAPPFLPQTLVQVHNVQGYQVVISRKRYTDPFHIRSWPFMATSAGGHLANTSIYAESRQLPQCKGRQKENSGTEPCFLRSPSPQNPGFRGLRLVKCILCLISRRVGRYKGGFFLSLLGGVPGYLLACPVQCDKVEPQTMEIRFQRERL